MARQESEREDLLREATALVERIELSDRHVPGSKPVTAGFRAEGALSIFFGADPAYQFNTRGELRRAYCHDLLYKAERGRLVSLRRDRRAGEVQLVRHELNDAQQDAFLRRMEGLLEELADGLTAGHYATVGQVPTDADVLTRLREWLQGRETAAIAATPHVRCAT
jgi:hypothetical protein